MSFNFSVEDRCLTVQNAMDEGYHVEATGEPWRVTFLGNRDGVYARIVDNALTLNKLPRWTKLTYQDSTVIPGHDEWTFKCKVSYTGNVRERHVGNTVFRQQIQAIIFLKIRVPEDRDPSSLPEGTFELRSVAVKVAPNA